jgi:transposase
LHVEGRSNSDQEPEEHISHITRGYSRDQRPDLNQVRLDLMVEHHAGIPVLMQPLRGKSSDAHDFGQISAEPMAQLQLTYGLTFLVAASALSSAANLQKLAATGTQWITRVPATLREAQAGWAQVNPPTMAPLMEQ